MFRTRRLTKKSSKLFKMSENLIYKWSPQTKTYKSLSMRTNGTRGSSRTLQITRTAVMKTSSTSTSSCTNGSTNFHYFSSVISQMILFRAMMRRTTSTRINSTRIKESSVVSMLQPKTNRLNRQRKKILETKCVAALCQTRKPTVDKRLWKTSACVSWEI